MLIQWRRVGLIFLSSLIASSLVRTAGQGGVFLILSLIFLHVNLRGYSGVAKIIAEPSSSITDLWICLESPITSFAWAIFLNLL